MLTEVDQASLAVALCGADGALTDRVFRCVSERVGASLREEIEMAGEPDTRTVEDAQRSVVAAVLLLAESGEVTIRDADFAPA